MDFKNFFKSLILYKPDYKYQFDLPQNESHDEQSKDSANDSNKESPIFPSVTVNLEYIKTKYNLLINSDIVLREFILNARGKQYNAFLIFIDGMIDTQIMDKFILEPLMIRNKNNLYDGEQNRIISEAVTNNITVRKVKKFDLPTYVKSCLIPQNSLKEISSFEEAFIGINSGNCILFVDTLNLAFDIEVKGFKQRSVEKPQNEVVINGPHEAYVENIRTNTALIRRIVNNENLIVEDITIGNITKTKCALFYIKDITNEALVSEVRYRLNNIEIDSLLSSGQLEQLISEDSFLSVPQILATERPDKTVGYLLNGRIAIIVNGTPYALILPIVLTDLLGSPDDKNIKPQFSNFLKAIRLLASLITLLLPGLYIAITSFHQEILPTELLFSILSSRSNVPFPIIVEILLLEISFELIREAGLRVPSPIGPTIGIVGALVLGEAAVSAGIVSPILIIVVAITGISSFVIPDFSFGFHLRINRFVFIILGFIAGFLGISLGLFAYMCVISNTKSFGIPYTTGITPLDNIKGNTYYLPPIWKREYRASFLNSKKERKQPNISMKWKTK